VTAFFVFNNKNINIWKGFIEMENNSIQKKRATLEEQLKKQEERLAQTKMKIKKKQAREKDSERKARAHRFITRFGYIVQDDMFPAMSKCNEEKFHRFIKELRSQSIVISIYNKVFSEKNPTVINVPVATSTQNPVSSATPIFNAATPAPSLSAPSNNQHEKKT